MTDLKQPPMDEDIRQQLQAGEVRPAFEQLLERYSQKVFHLALSLVRNETQAEDLTQEVFLKIWKGLPGYHGQASLSTWIYAIARNTCLTELKRRAARPTVSFQEPDGQAALESEAVLHTEPSGAGARSDVHQLLQQLPDKYQQVIRLFYLEQKSYEEVSALLGLPLGTVKTFLYRAKKQLLQLSRATPAHASLPSAPPAAIVARSHGGEPVRPAASTCPVLPRVVPNLFIL